jgi:hypothetical protein
MPFLLYHLVGLGLMKKEETQREYGDLEATAFTKWHDRGRRACAGFVCRSPRPSEVSAVMDDARRRLTASIIFELGAH